MPGAGGLQRTRTDRTGHDRPGRADLDSGSANSWAGLRCTEFPTHDPVGPKPVRGEGAPPVVVIGALQDGATPVHWSEALADQLVSARLVIADTDVHSVYPDYDACVARIVDEFLLDGVAPPRKSECPAD